MAALPPLLVTLVWAGVLLLPAATHGAAVAQPRTLPFSWNLEPMARALQLDWPPGSPKAVLLAQALERLLEAEAGWQERKRETEVKAAALTQLLWRLWSSSRPEPEVSMEEVQAKEGALLRFLMSRLLAKMSETRITPTLVWGEPWLPQRRRLRRDLGPGPASMSQGTALLHLNRLEASGAKGRAQVQQGVPLATTHYWPE
ncbi:uncharacterized protein LOC122733400 isoform X2 [Dromiciops gliroides]|uniref:uncharacterized protein LOC122733400 isoform X2 n=1 Tax=Dromiciops gliroides TaxID=33562 RepID=UPI001CC6A38F|nr:uncharacterized protein LOC122733400 isoform X2 [Dromiciops gliroides]